MLFLLNFNKQITFILCKSFHKTEKREGCSTILMRLNNTDLQTTKENTKKKKKSKNNTRPVLLINTKKVKNKIDKKK